MVRLNFEFVLNQQDVKQPLRFPGQVEDTETGFYYNYHRYYNPEIGRYIQPDPIGLAGGINPYVYADNNPIMNVDSSGLETEIIIWQPYGWGSSSFGHVSANINGKNYSWGPRGWDSRSQAADYISRQTEFRSGSGVQLNLTKQQESSLASCLNNYRLASYHAVLENCGTPFKDCLAMEGVDLGYPLFPASIGDALLQSNKYLKSTFYEGPERGFLKNILRGDVPDAWWAR